MALGTVTDTPARTGCTVRSTRALERLVERPAFQQPLLQALETYVERYGVAYLRAPSVASS